jgi:Holliday junction resolvasome RuvABC DNA-binding subunit
MEQEKTLLQQIREKEQEYAGMTDAIKKETDAAITAVENEAESMLCTADSTGKIEAEQLYWQEKGKIEAEIEGLKREAMMAREKAAAAGEKNLPRAIETITRSVIME